MTRPSSVASSLAVSGMKGLMVARKSITNLSTNRRCSRACPFPELPSHDT